MRSKRCWLRARQKGCCCWYFELDPAGICSLIRVFPLELSMQTGVGHVVFGGWRQDTLWQYKILRKCDAGETYQRPSPTDSNASNNTSEQAVSLPPPASRPIPKSPASSSMNKAPLAPLGKPLAARGGKVTKGRELPAAAKANLSKRMRTTNPAPQTGRSEHTSLPTLTPVPYYLGLILGVNEGLQGSAIPPAKLWGHICKSSRTSDTKVVSDIQGL